MITRGLIIKKQWLDLIFDAVAPKTWEMRSRETKIRGRVALIEGGSGMIVGETNIIGCGGRLTSNFQHSASLIHHKINDFSLLEKWHTPWILSESKRYEKPIPYTHPKGAVIWVNLEGGISL